MFYTFLKEIVVSQIPDDTLGKYLSNNSLLEPFWKSLDSIGNVEEGKQLLNSTLQNITQTIDKEDIEDFISNKTLNERINQGMLIPKLHMNQIEYTINFSRTVRIKYALLKKHQLTHFLGLNMMEGVMKNLSTYISCFEFDKFEPMGTEYEMEEKGKKTR